MDLLRIIRIGIFVSHIVEMPTPTHYFGYIFRYILTIASWHLRVRHITRDLYHSFEMQSLPRKVSCGADAVCR